MSNITQHDKRLAEIEATATTSAEEIAARTRLSAALARVGVPDNWTPPVSTRRAPAPPTTVEDRLRAGRTRIAQEGGPAAQIVASAPIAPPAPAEALPGDPGKPGPTPAVSLDRAALFDAFSKSARGNLQTVDICNFNTAFATARDTGAAFIAPPLTPAKQQGDATPANPGAQYNPYEDLA